MDNSSDALDAQILEDFKRVKSGQFLPPGLTLNFTAEELAKELAQMAGSRAHKRTFLPYAKEWGYAAPFWSIRRRYQLAAELVALHSALIVGAILQCKLSKGLRSKSVEDLFMEELRNNLAFMRDRPLALEFLARFSCYGEIIDSGRGGRDLASAFFAVIKCDPLTGPRATERLERFAEQIDIDKSVLCRLFHQTRVT